MAHKCGSKSFWIKKESNRVAEVQGSERMNSLSYFLLLNVYLNLLMTPSKRLINKIAISIKENYLKCII